MEKELTRIQAFQAMIKFLEKYYNFTKSDDIGSLLGDMDTSFWENGKTFDLALWRFDWIGWCCIAEYKRKKVNIFYGKKNLSKYKNF